MKQVFRTMAVKCAFASLCLVIFATAILGWTSEAQAHTHATVFYYSPTLTTYCNPGWTFWNDSLGHTDAYTPSNGKTGCAHADWLIYKTSCPIQVYIPRGHATADVTYGLFNDKGKRVKLVVIHQAKVEGYQLLAKGTNITRVNVSNNNGSLKGQIGVGTNPEWSLRVACA